LRSPNLDDFIDIKLSLDWEGLKERVKVVGIRNATLLAVAPVESSSVVVDSTNGIEMPKSLISTKESRGSSLVQVAPEYEKLKDHYQLM
jgi:ribonucleoside-diphosphate reductase alpha chain